MYTIQVWTEHYWWIADDKTGAWRTIYRDNERRKPKTFTSQSAAIQYLTTKNPYYGRKGQRRIVKGNQVILEL